MPDPDDPIDPESFAATVPLTDVFGTHPKTLLVSAMLTESSDPETPFSRNELARISGLEIETVDAHVDELRSVGIVVQTDDIDDSPAYLLNDELDVVDDIKRLYDDTFELTT